MRQGSRFNLEDVIRHLPGSDTSLRSMNTPLRVPLKASANRRRESFFNHSCTVSMDVVQSVDLTIKPLLSSRSVILSRVRHTLRQGSLFPSASKGGYVFQLLDKQFILV